MTNPNSAAQAATQHPIDEAIGLLTAEAESIRECHTPGCDRNDWTGESEAKAAHDNMMRVAAALSKLRAPVADERAAFARSITGRDDLEPHQVHNVIDANGSRWATWRDRAALATVPLPNEPPIRLSAEVVEYLKEGIENATQCDEADIDYDFANELGRLIQGPLFGAPPASAPVAGEPFMYGIMGPDGKAHLDEFCVSADPAELEQEVVAHVNEDHKGGKYSVVALFANAAPQASESDFAKLQSAYVGACDQIAELLAEKQARGGENHV